MDNDNRLREISEKLERIIQALDKLKDVIRETRSYR